jgi:endonuclease/exonuclease/phosphatase family metal-dependent hydrolase
MRKAASILAAAALLSLPSLGAPARGEAPALAVRIAQFNVWELSTAKILETDGTGAGGNAQLLAAAAIIRDVAPDILILNEIDHDVGAAARGEDLALNARRFNDRYLRGGEDGLDYAYAFAAPCNTGFLTGYDLNNDGVVATDADRGGREHGGDCYGYGAYPGQYSMAVLSRFPLEADAARTFRLFRWVDLPDNLIPPGWFTEAELEIYRLSSKSHWDLPVRIGDAVVHLLLSHPTPIGYDGPEDLNGRRNHDELRLWVHYLDDDAVPVDDAGVRGGLPAGERFIVAGDLNTSPRDEPPASGAIAIDQLLKHPRVQDTGAFLTSAGALDGRAPGPPDHLERRTFGRGQHARRIDYILPSVGLTPLAGGVYWPDPRVDPEGEAMVHAASDHRLTWLDLELR